MASFQLAPGERLVKCPYDESHVILETKIMVHVDKCRRNYIMQNGGNEDKVPCGFNFLHKVDKKELFFHQQVCPDRHNVEKYIRHHQLVQHQKKIQAGNAGNDKPKIDYGFDDPEEDWEKDSNGSAPGYDPSKKPSREPPIPQGMTKTERKAYRQKILEERFDKIRETL